RPRWCALRAAGYGYIRSEKCQTSRMLPMSCGSWTALWCYSHLHGNAGHAMLSTEGFELRSATWYQGIHIHTWHAMRHHDCTRGGTAGGQGWQLEGCTRTVQ